MFSLLNLFLELCEYAVLLFLSAALVGVDALLKLIVFHLQSINDGVVVFDLSLFVLIVFASHVELSRMFEAFHIRSIVEGGFIGDGNEFPFEELILLVYLIIGEEDVVVGSCQPFISLLVEVIFVDRQMFANLNYLERGVPWAIQPLILTSVVRKSFSFLLP